MAIVKWIQKIFKQIKNGLRLRRVVRRFKGVHLFHDWRKMEIHNSFGGHNITVYRCRECGASKEYLD